MDNVQRNILESVDINQLQNEINRLNPSVLRGIEGSTLHFITVPRTGDQEYIEHNQILTPEYIAAHFQNGLVVDILQTQATNFLPQNGNHHTISIDRQYLDQSDILQQHQQIDVQRNGGNVDHRNKGTISGTTTGTHFLQYIQQQPTKLEPLTMQQHQQQNDTDSQVIVTNKMNPPLPPLAKISNNRNNISSRKMLTQTFNTLPPPQQQPIQILKEETDIDDRSDDDEFFDDSESECEPNIMSTSSSIAQNVNNRKLPKQLISTTLPHKKRISTKMKTGSSTYNKNNNNNTSTQFIFTNQQQPSNSDSDGTNNMLGIMYEIRDINETSSSTTTSPMKLLKTNNGDIVKYQCELCGMKIPGQLDFFAHLKIHYEPTTKIDNPKMEPVSPKQSMLNNTNTSSLQSTVNLPPLQAIDASSVKQLHMTVQNHKNTSSVRQQSTLFFSNNDQEIHQTDVDINEKSSPLLNHCLTNNLMHTDTPSMDTDSNDDYDHEDDVDEDTNAVVNQQHNMNDTKMIEDENDEFSDTEDMLEGIRGVVDKVQESVDNDLNNEQISIKDWYHENIGESIVFHSTTNNSDGSTNGHDHQTISVQLNGGNGQSSTSMADQEQQQSSTSTGTISATTENGDLVIFYSDKLLTDSNGKFECDLNASILRHELLKGPSTAALSAIVPDNAHTEHVSPPPAAPPPMIELPTQLLTSDASTNIITNNNTSINIVHKDQRKLTLNDIQSEFTEEDIEENETEVDAKGKKIKTKRKRKVYRCKRCDKLCNSKNALLYHFLSHTGERPHQCEVCGKSFFAGSALKVHKRLHSGDKPYTCMVCSRAFRQWGDLKYHITSLHTDEKNHQCEFCGKDFARRYSLVIHRRIHTGEKNYKCEYCSKTFRASSYLQDHRKIHTGERPHACDVCGKKFRVRGDLKRHLKIHNRQNTVAAKPKLTNARSSVQKSNISTVTNKSTDEPNLTENDNFSSENQMVTFKQEESEDLMYDENELEIFGQSTIEITNFHTNDLINRTTTVAATTAITTSESINNTEKSKRKTKRKSRKKSDGNNTKQKAVIKVPTTNYEVNAALRAKLLGTTAVVTTTSSTTGTSMLNVVDSRNKSAVTSMEKQQQQLVTDNAVQSWPVDMSKVLQQCDIDRNIQMANGLQQLINQQQQQVVVTSTGANNGTTVGQQVFVWPIDMSSYIT